MTNLALGAFTRMTASGMGKKSVLIFVVVLGAIISTCAQQPSTPNPSSPPAPVSNLPAASPTPAPANPAPATAAKPTSNNDQKPSETTPQSAAPADAANEKKSGTPASPDNAKN